MKIANFTDTYLPHNNGVATSLYRVHHAKKDWQDELFGPIDHQDVHKVGGVPFPLFPEYKLALDTGSLKKKVQDCDVIHVHTPYGMFYYAHKLAREMDKPLVGTFHTDPAAVFGALISVESKLGGPATKITWKYLINLYNKCDSVIAVSGWLERELKERGMTAPVVTIPNGVDTNEFNPAINPSDFKKKYEIGNEKLVMFMGRFQHKKDPITFVKAALESESEATFFMAGIGELRDRLKRMAGGDPRIKFNGLMSSEMVHQAYAATDIFVMPSEMETQGVVLLEAMASGTPCIATDVGISREILKPDQIMKHRDHKGLAHKIDALLSDEKKLKNLADSGRKLIEKEYSIEANVHRLEDLYKSLI